MRTWRLDHAPLMLAAAYMVVVLALCRPQLPALLQFLGGYALSLCSVWTMVGLCVLLGATVRVQRSGGDASAFAIARHFAVRSWAADRGLSVLAPLLTVVVLLCSYNIYKAFYLPTAGFWFEGYADAADRLMFGADAWRLTHAALPSPWATQAIDMAYHGWFLPMVVGVALCSFAPPRARLRQRYLLAYVLLWIVQGSILAYLMPAAGPCFYGAFQADPGRFAALTGLLDDQNRFLLAQGAPGLYALVYQHGLLSLHHAPEMAMGAGISAMPSMHNAMAVLFACAAWTCDRRLGIAAALYALLIWVGSVHLGWHYAADGIVAAGLTLVTWAALARLPAPHAPAAIRQADAVSGQPVAA
ncbi:phosphatase PAP2 family protein [Sphingomonas flavalba]|uniref:phosphatase PAP2 family protein n=1 Tax=Sphingomonas flavalba TaxID=2559804 RepID=UPI00109E2065|nr:phosphatase PAP2 family protein [Sphingomonas flavalba]